MFGGGFGGAMFQGGDDNAAAMGAGDSSGEFSSTNPGGYMQTPGDQYAFSSTNPNGDPNSMATDPAEQASQDATQNVKQDNSGQGVAGEIGKSAGLFSSIWSIFNPKAKRLQRRQRIFARMQAANQLAQSQRNVAQYAQDSQIQEQRLQQSYAARGIGNSSIQTSGMQYFHDTQARTMEQLAQGVALSQANQNLVRSQISTSYMQPYLSFGNAAANLF